MKSTPLALILLSASTRIRTATAIPTKESIPPQTSSLQIILRPWTAYILQ